jgi:hypothetical protein
MTALLYPWYEVRFYPAADPRTSWRPDDWVHVSIPASAKADEMVDQQTMRASDRDRQQMVDRLRSALEDGRLTMDEYVDRLEAAYQAATYSDLAPLCADLPVSTPVIAGPETAAGTTAPPAAVSRAGYPGRPAGRAQIPVDQMAGRRVGQRGRLDAGQRCRRSPGLPLAGLGCRSVRGGAVRRVSWRHAVPAQPAARRAPAAGQWLTRSTLPARSGPQIERLAGVGSARLAGSGVLQPPVTTIPVPRRDRRPS